jgi:uncharacterized protein
MEKIALIGASGFVGSAILYELLQRNHKVTAIVRDIKSLRSNNNITFLNANVLNPKELSKALDGNDIATSAYNAGWTNPNLYNDFMIGSEIIQECVKHANINRLIVSGGAGSLYIIDNLQLVDKIDFPSRWKPGALAARDYLNYLKEEKELDWCFVSPAIEMNLSTSGIRTGTYRTGLDNPVYDQNGASNISVEDLAMAFVDEVENPKHHRQRFTVGY